MKTEPSNKPTAELRIAILKYVMEHDYYPHDWFDLNDLETSLMNNEITYEEYNTEIVEMSKEWLG